MATEHERYVAARYPGSDARVAHLCECDPRFEGLCRRYKEVGCRLLVLEHAGMPYVEAEAHDLREEQASLEAEIRSRLR